MEQDSFEGESFQREPVQAEEDGLLSGSISASAMEHLEESAPRTPPPSPHASPPFVTFGDAIGSGGQGTVHRAVQASLQRIVALKRPNGAGAAGKSPPSGTSRQSLSFLREAMTTALLDHPNILQVHDIGLEPDGTPYLAMKLVRGRLWDDVLSEDKDLPPATYLARHVPILLDVAQAVAFAHSRGILHRDLNPTQVMVGEFGEVYVMDWGLAVSWRPELLAEQRREVAGALGISPEDVAALAAPTLATAAAPAGTRAWMAPEQNLPSATALGPWTDVYLLGGILYRLLTQTVPHPRLPGGERPIEPLPPPSTRAPDRYIPRPLESLAMRATEHDHRERIADVREFVRRLQEYLAGSQRLEEARRLLAETRGRLEERPIESLGYEELGTVERDLSRSIEHDPELAEAVALREAVILRQVQAALSHGDLELARATLLRIPLSHERRGELTMQVERAVERRARNARRQGIATAAAAVLFAVAGSLGTYAFFAQDRADRAEAVAAIADRERSSAERTVQLLQDIAWLTKEEAELVSIFERLYPVPELAPAGRTPRGPAVAEQDLALEYHRRAERARTKRNRILQLEAGSKALLGPEPRALVMASLNDRLSGARSAQEFAALYSEILAIPPSRMARDADVESRLGYAALRAGLGTSATLHLRAAIENIERNYGTFHPEYGLALQRIALAYGQNEERPAEDRRFFEESIKAQERNWIEFTGTLLKTKLQVREEPHQAAYATLLLDVVERQFGPESLEAGQATWLAGSVARSTMSVSEARRLHERARETIAQHLGVQSTEYAQLTVDYALTLAELGRYARAVELAQTAIATLLRNTGKYSREYRQAQLSLAEIMLAEGVAEPAIALLREVREADVDRFGGAHPDSLVSALRLAQALAADPASLRNRAEADAIAKEVASRGNETLGNGHPTTLDALAVVANELAMAGEATAAQELFLTIRARTIARFGMGSERHATLDYRIARLLLDANKSEAAEPHFRTVEEYAARHPGDLRASVRLHRLELVRALRAGAGRHAVAHAAACVRLLLQRDLGEARLGREDLIGFLQAGAGALALEDRIAAQHLLLQEASEAGVQNAVWVRAAMLEYLRSILYSSSWPLPPHRTENVLVTLRNLETHLRSSVGAEETSTDRSCEAINTYAAVALDALGRCAPESPGRDPYHEQARGWVLAALKVANRHAAQTPARLRERLRAAGLHGLAEDPALLSALCEGPMPLRYAERFRQPSATTAELLALADELRPAPNWEALLPELREVSLLGLTPGISEMRREVYGIAMPLSAKVIGLPSGQEDGNARR